MFLAAILWAVSAPLVGTLAFVADLVRRERYATLRMWLFAGAYLWGEIAGVVFLAAAWIGSAFGRNAPRLRQRAYEVQRAWLRGLWRATQWIYSLEVTVERPDGLPPGPFIVLVRHTSLLDIMIPGVVVGADYKVQLRYVVKRELLVGPCVDIAGHWMPNHFVDRSGKNRKRELEALRALSTGMHDGEGVAMYPEGTRFSVDRRRRSLARLALQDRELHGLALRCHHTLPPRPGGTLALLNGSPDADILVVEHAGFLGFTNFNDLWAGRLTGRKIRVRVRHIARDQVPFEADARVRWLFDLWAGVDAWVSTRETRLTQTTTSRQRSVDVQ